MGISKYAKFDRSLLTLQDLSVRESKVVVRDMVEPAFWVDSRPPEQPHADRDGLAAAVKAAKARKAPIIWFIAGHVVKHGLSKFLVDLMSQGYCTHLACNGSVLIHEFELLTHGETSEDVGKYIRDGSFGNWRDTAVMNRIINKARSPDMGLGEIFGQWTVDTRKTASWSLLHQAYIRDIPVTSHVLVGGDIIHQHPNCSGANIGRASYNDFLVFTQSVYNMAGGVFINVGSQVTGTEVFLKALSMARNARHHNGGDPIHDITTGLLDFVNLPPTWRNGEASEGEAAYYYRPYKSLLLRTVADGGHSFYLGGPHVETLPNLWRSIRI